MSKNKTDESIEVVVRVLKKRFYSEGNSFGIFEVYLTDDKINHENSKLMSTNPKVGQMFIITGNMPVLETDRKYSAFLEEKNHPKFGLQYETKIIYEKLMSNREDQMVFLKTVLTPSQADTLLNAYKDTEIDIIELIKSDNIDLKLLHGIGAVKIENIKNKIIENEKYQKSIVELSRKYDLSYNVIVSLTNKYGSPELLLEKIEENPYILSELDGFGFKRVDEIALSMGVDKDSVERIESCIKYVLKEASSNEGHIWVKTNKVISEAIKLTGLRIAKIQEALKDITKEKYSNINMVGDRLFLLKNFMCEYEIHNNVKRLLDETPKVSFNFDFDKAVSMVENSQGFEFTEEQKVAIMKGIENNVIVINGKAGSGKTSVIKGVIEVLKMHHESLMKENASILELEYATCALSGKASQRIQESTGLKSATIHRLLGYNPRIGWMYDESNHMPYDVIVLDEASMVNSHLFLYLIRAVKSGAKLIITGDTAQLEPIGEGNVLVDLLKTKSIPSVELTIVHRQAQKSGILSNANKVRDGINFFKGQPVKFSKIGELKDLYMYPNKERENVLKRVLDIASKYSEDIMDFQILTPMKTKGELSTQNVNNKLQLIFNKDPEDVDELNKIVRKHSTLLEGDKVIINGNNYDKNVFNGTMGIIEYINSQGSGEIIVDFEGIGRISFNKNDMSNIELGYAITIHKSQGSQWKYVVLAFDYSSYVLLNRQSAYTGMTRAILYLFFVFEIKALDYAIRTDNSSDRNTLLTLFLDNDETEIREFSKRFEKTA